MDNVYTQSVVDKLIGRTKVSHLVPVYNFK